MEGKWYFPRALSNTNPGSLRPDFRDPDTETGKLEIEKRVHRIHETLETGLHKDPLQPGGPLKGGQWIEDVSAMQLCNFSCQAEWLKNLKKNGRIISSNAVG